MFVLKHLIPKEKKEIDNQEAVCPYCGYEQNDTWEYFMHDNQTAEIECSVCGEEFITFINTEMTYSTEKKE